MLYRSVLKTTAVTLCTILAVAALTAAGVRPGTSSLASVALDGSLIGRDLGEPGAARQVGEGEELFARELSEPEVEQFLDARPAVPVGVAGTGSTVDSAGQAAVSDTSAEQPLAPEAIDEASSTTSRPNRSESVNNTASEKTTTAPVSATSSFAAAKEPDGKSAPTTTAAPKTTVAPKATAAPKNTTTTTTTAAPTSTAAPKPASGTPLLTVNFSNNDNGGYSSSDVQNDFGAINYARTDRASIQSENGNQFLRVFFPKGGVGPDAGGAQFSTDFKNSIGLHDELYVSYKVRFGARFDFKQGGKLPGFGAGWATGGGRKPDGHNGFSTRMMWRNNGAPISYVYHPNMPGQYGEGMYWDGGNFTAGQWTTVETRLKLNTPGQNDGVLQGWRDGRLVLERKNMRFRDTGDLHIENLLFSAFFGGADSSWAPSKDEHIDFDDFKVSKFPITH